MKTTFTEKLITAYVLFYLCLFPIAMRNFYFDILGFRFALFWKPTLCIALVLAAWNVVKWITSGKKQINIRDIWKQTEVCDRVFFLYIISMIVTTIAAPYRYEAFWGSLGRNMGLLIWLSFFAAYVMVRCYYHFQPWHLYAFLIAGCIPCLIGMLHFFDIDLFHMFDGTSPDRKVTFMSTFGNINTYTAYVALLVAASACLFVLEASYYGRLIALCIFIIAAVALVMGKSDNALLSSGIIFAVLPFFCRSMKELRRYIEAAAVFLLACILTNRISTTDTQTIAMWDMGVLSKIGGMQVSHILMGGMMFIIIVLYILRKKTDSERYLLYCKKIWFGFLVVSILIIAALFMDANMGNHPERYEKYAGFLIFNDEWGTDRGVNWRYAFRYFTKEADLFRKLIGIGPDCYYITIAEKYTMTTADGMNIKFDTPHNEYIGMIICQGLIGFILFVTWIMTSLSKMLHTEKNRAHISGIALAIIAYSTQAFVNFAVPITYVIMMLLWFAGIQAAYEDEKQSLRR